MKNIFLITLTFILFSCNNQTDNSSDKTKETVQAENLDSLTQSKSLLDSAISKKSMSSECLYLTSGSFQKGDCNQKEYSEVWRIWKNSSQQITTAKHEFSSESMDIYVQDLFYFKANGELFCKDEFVSFMNSICSDKGMINNTTYFYNNGIVIDSLNSLYDSDNVKFGKDSCLIPYSIKVETPNNIIELKKVIGLGLK
jgi:hypothetical protein